MKTIVSQQPKKKPIKLFLHWHWNMSEPFMVCVCVHCVHFLFDYLHFRLLLFTHKWGDEQAAHKRVRRYAGLLLYQIQMPQIFRCDSLDSCVTRIHKCMHVCESKWVFVHFMLGISTEHTFENVSKKNAGNTIIEFEKNERKKKSGVSFFMKFDNDAPNQKSEWKK